MSSRRVMLLRSLAIAMAVTGAALVTAGLAGPHRIGATIPAASRAMDGGAAVLTRTIAGPVPGLLLAPR